MCREDRMEGRGTTSGGGLVDGASEKRGRTLTVPSSEAVHNLPPWLPATRPSPTHRTARLWSLSVAYGLPALAGSSGSISWDTR